jgi:hypothetical protein
MSRAEGRQAQDGSGACRQALTGQALVHGYDTAFWWTAGIFAGGASSALPCSAADHWYLEGHAPPGTRRSVGDTSQAAALKAMPATRHPAGTWDKFMLCTYVRYEPTAVTALGRYG